jgi:hypothetical protein
MYFEFVLVFLFKIKPLPGMVIHACNLSSQEAEVGG